MVLTARQCLTRILCVPRHFKLKTFTVKQRLRDEMLSPLSINMLINEINDNSNKTLAIQDPSGGAITKKAQDHNDIEQNMTGEASQLNPKAPSVTIRQHLKDEVVSSLSGNIFLNDSEKKRKDAHDYNSITVKADVPELFQIKVSTVKINHHKNKVVSALPENILNNRKYDQIAISPMKQNYCGKEIKNKLQECNVGISPPGSLKQSKPVDTAIIKEHFKTNAVPPFSGKICIALQVRFQVRNETDNKGKQSKFVPKCQNEPNSSSNGLKLCARNVNESNKPIPYNEPCKPKSK